MQVGHPYRDPAFLSSPKAPKAPPVEVQLLPREKFDALRGGQSAGAGAPIAGASTAALPLGSTADEARALLGQHIAPVLRLPHARGLLCGAGDAQETARANSLSSQLLRVPQW